MFGDSQDQTIGWASTDPGREGGAPLGGSAGRWRLSNEIITERGRRSESAILSGAAESGDVWSRAYYPLSATLRPFPPARDSIPTPSPFPQPPSDNLRLRYHSQSQPDDHSAATSPLPHRDLTTSVSTSPTALPPSLPQLPSPMTGRDRDTNGPARFLPQSHRVRPSDRAGLSMDLASAHNIYETTGEDRRRSVESEDEMATPQRVGASCVDPGPRGFTTIASSNIWNASGATSSWDDNPPSPPSFGSSASASSSSSVESDYGGAIVMPRDTPIGSNGRGERKKRFARRIYADMDADTTDDESEGGIGFDMDMDTDAFYPPPSTMIVDEDEGFSPANPLIRPPSAGGGLVGIHLLSPRAEDERPSTSSMHLDSPFLTPSSSTYRVRSTPPTPALQATPYNVQILSFASPTPEEDEEILMPDTVAAESTASRDHLLGDPSTSESPVPQVAIVVPEYQLGDEPVDFGGAFVVEVPAADEGFLSPPSLGATVSFLENHPHISAFPNYSMTDTITPLPLPDPLEDELDDIPPSSNGIAFDGDPLAIAMATYNSDFAGFCSQLWHHHHETPTLQKRLRNFAAPLQTLPAPDISPEGTRVSEWAKTRPEEITQEDVVERGYDIQGIPWDKLQLEKKVARRYRQSRYINYRNIQTFTKEDLPPIKSTREFYSFLRHTTLPCKLIHFQLRNILALTDRNNIFFSTGDQVTSYHPITRNICASFMDLGEEALSDFYPIRISTLSACGGRDAVLMAGGFDGTFALKPLNANATDKPITGTITDNDSGITNHIQIINSRRTGTPHAVISSNDDHIRIMDVYDPRRRFVAQHRFQWPVNCSATSPDSRLRVVVGDSKDVVIVDAERGRTEFVLPGHQDFGFAAAWSEDGVTIATGNQDQTVRIFDARMFRVVKVLPMKMAGCRTLRFSPLGGGGRPVLAMAEPADLVHFVDTTTWEEAQTFRFWGEVGGIEFSPDGEECVIANADRSVGGLTTLRKRRGVDWYADGRQERGRGRRWTRRGADMGEVFV